MTLNLPRVTGKPTGPREGRVCAKCIFFQPWPVTQYVGEWDYQDYDRPNDQHGNCDHPQFTGWRVRTDFFWCDGWVPDMSKL